MARVGAVMKTGTFPKRVFIFIVTFFISLVSSQSSIWGTDGIDEAFSGCFGHGKTIKVDFCKSELACPALDKLLRSNIGKSLFERVVSENPYYQDVNSNRGLVKQAAVIKSAGRQHLKYAKESLLKFLYTAPFPAIVAEALLQIDQSPETIQSVVSIHTRIYGGGSCIKPYENGIKHLGSQVIPYVMADISRASSKAKLKSLFRILEVFESEEVKPFLTEIQKMDDRNARLNAYELLIKIQASNKDGLHAISKQLQTEPDKNLPLEVLIGLKYSGYSKALREIVLKLEDPDLLQALAFNQFDEAYSKLINTGYSIELLNSLSKGQRERNFLFHELGNRLDWNSISAEVKKLRESDDIQVKLWAHAAVVKKENSKDDLKEILLMNLKGSNQARQAAAYYLQSKLGFNEYYEAATGFVSIGILILCIWLAFERRSRGDEFSFIFALTVPTLVIGGYMLFFLYLPLMLPFIYIKVINALIYPSLFIFLSLLFLCIAQFLERKIPSRSALWLYILGVILFFCSVPAYLFQRHIFYESTISGHL